MNFRIPPKIAVINSFAGYGRCSITEALPIISAMRVQACPVPTSVFSNHTGFSTHYSVDLTAHMAGYFNQWDSLGLVFDGICCGFLGKKEQVPLVAAFLRGQRQKGCPMILVDPVMGDHGRAYKTVTPEHCSALKELVSLADIITPNITEACLLTGTPYRENGWREDELEKLCASLHGMGPEKLAVTGLRCKTGSDGEDGFLNLVSELPSSKKTPKITRISVPSAGPSRHGTGDIFAAILAADAAKGAVFPASVQKAADFIATCIRASEALGIPEQEGVCFENLLDTLS